MAVGSIKSRRVGDLDAAKKRNAQGSADSFALNVKPDSEISIRFIDEPDQWSEFWQHYLENAEPRFFPCNDGDCVGCDAGHRPTKKWAARVIDVTEGKLRVFIFGKKVWEKLLGRRCFEKFHTILDRNYLVIRTGSTKNDTDYDVDPEERRRFDLSKFKADLKKLDTDEFLVAQIPTDGDDDDDEEEPEFARRRPAKKGGRRTTPRQRSRADDDEDDDEEEERPRRATARKPASRKAAKRRTSSARR